MSRPLKAGKQYWMGGGTNGQMHARRTGRTMGTRPLEDAPVQLAYNDDGSWPSSRVETWLAQLAQGGAGAGSIRYKARPLHPLTGYLL